MTNDDIVETLSRPGLPSTLGDLEREINDALAQLNDRQRTFVHLYVDGEATSLSEAAKMAGFGGGPSQAANQLKQRPPVARALELLQYRKELRIGIEAARKRAVLMDVAERHKVETPSASVAAVRELNSMDGDKAELQVRVNGTITHRAEPFSDPELAMRLAAMERQVGHSLVMPDGKINPVLLGAEPIEGVAELVEEDDDNPPSLF